MSPRTLLNLGLAGLALALVLVVVYRPGLEPEAVPQPIIAGLAPDAVVSITVTREPREQLTFTRQADRWYLFTGKRELPAAEFQVNALLRLLQTTADNHYPAATLDMAQLGLEPAQATVTFNEQEIRIGATEALQQRRYVLIDDSVYLIADKYQHLVNAEPTNFVARELLTDRGAISRLELPALKLSQSDGGHWQLDPADDSAGADALQQLVDSWQNASALYVSGYDGTATAEQVTIHTTGQAEPLVLQVVSHAPDLVLARADWGIKYHLASGLEGSLFALPTPEPENENTTGDTEGM
jgi:VCBS repeat-containing protein